MRPILLTNARIIDGDSADCPDGMQVLIKQGQIRDVSSRPVKALNAHVIDVGGRTLMRGLIDAHMHAYGCDVNVQKIEFAGDAYRCRTDARLRAGLRVDDRQRRRRRRFQSLARHRGRPDPRSALLSGEMLSMTGSHGDLRTMAEAHHEYCRCAASNSLCVSVDGVDEHKAAREQLRCGVSMHRLADSSAPPADTASKRSSPRSAP